MWVGVCLSVVVELMPEKLRNSAVGFYFFIISNIGGNMQLLVPPLQNALKSGFNIEEFQAFRVSLLIFYPGEYVLGSALFLLTLFVLKRDLERVNRLKNDAIQPNQLVTNVAVDDNGNEKVGYDNPGYDKK